MSTDCNNDEDDAPDATDGARERDTTISLGTSLLAVAFFVLGGFSLLMVIPSLAAGDWKWEDFNGALGCGVVFLAMGSATLIRGARQVRRQKLARKHHRENRCPHCGYPRRGLPGPRCPECGRLLPDLDEEV